MALRWSAGRPSFGTRHWWRMVLEGLQYGGGEESDAGAALGDLDADPFKRFNYLISRLGTEVLDLE